MNVCYHLYGKDIRVVSIPPERSIKTLFDLKVVKDFRYKRVGKK